jgi:hypothetical protein
MQMKPLNLNGCTCWFIIREIIVEKKKRMIESIIYEVFYLLKIWRNFINIFITIL